MKLTVKTWLLTAALFYLPFAVATPTQVIEPRFGVNGAGNLGLFLVIHNQVNFEEYAQMRAHMNDFLAHLEEATGQRTTVTIIDDAPGLTDFGYRQDDVDQMLRDFYSASNDYADQNNLPPPSDRHKYLLVTSNKLNWTHHGISVKSHNIGVASLKEANTLPHEIGHLIGAEHEAATGFPCQTIMWDDSVTSVNACNTFSEGNQQAIRDYLSEAR